MQPPKILEQIIKYLLVSNILPGPTISSHQPFLFVTGFLPVTN